MKLMLFPTATDISNFPIKGTCNLTIVQFPYLRGQTHLTPKTSKKMVFILDTNAYRTLAHGKKIYEIAPLAHQLKAAEQAKGHSSVASTTVTMELMKHLIPGDAAMDVCYNALCLQVFHCSTHDRSTGTLSGSFIPALNDILANIFFDKSSIFLPLYQAVHELAATLAIAKDVKACLAYEEKIRAIKKQILFEIDGFRENLEDLLASMNGGKVDWKFIRNDSIMRKHFNERLHNGDFIQLLGIALMVRAHQVMDLDDFDTEAVKRFKDFLKNHEAAIRMNLSILESVAGGAEGLSNSDDKRWNTLNDVQIMMSALYDQKGIGSKVLVTEEKKIKLAAQAANVQGQVIGVNEYLSELGLAP